MQIFSFIIILIIESKLYAFKESKIRYGICDGIFSSIYYSSTAHQIEYELKFYFKIFMFLEMFSKLIFSTLTIIYSLKCIGKLRTEECHGRPKLAARILSSLSLKT